MRWLAAVGFAGRRGALVGAVRLAVAVPMRCPGRIVPSRSARCGAWGLGVCYSVGLVAGWEGFRYHADRLDGR